MSASALSLSVWAHYSVLDILRYTFHHFKYEHSSFSHPISLPLINLNPSLTTTSPSQLNLHPHFSPHKFSFPLETSQPNHPTQSPPPPNNIFFYSLYFKPSDPQPVSPSSALSFYLPFFSISFTTHHSPVLPYLPIPLLHSSHSQHLPVTKLTTSPTNIYKCIILSTTPDLM
jgi:hypothetical protein